MKLVQHLWPCLILQLCCGFFVYANVEVWRTEQNGTLIDSYVVNNTRRACEADETALEVKEDTIECTRDTEISEKGKCNYTKTMRVIWQSDNFTSCSLQDLTVHTKSSSGNNALAGSIAIKEYINVLDNTTIQRTGQTYFNSKPLELRFQCSRRNSTKDFCLVFTLPNLQDYTTTTVPPPTTASENTTTTAALNTTSQSTNNTTEISNGTAVRFTTTSTSKPLITATTNKTTRENLSAVIPTTAATTTLDTGVSSDDKGRVIIYALAGAGAALFLIIIAVVIYYRLCCRKRRQEKQKKQEFLINMSPLDDDPFSPTTNDSELYAVPIKKKRKQPRCFRFRNNPQKKQANQGVSWANYDEVGALIEGTYEKQESKFDDEDDPTQFGVSALYMRDNDKDRPGSRADIIDDPYEMIGRSNSFSKQPIKAQQNNLKPNSSPQIKLVDSPVTPRNDKHEPSTTPLKALENTQFNEIPSSFKPGGSIRMKQNRTSRKGRPEKENLLPDMTHEDVTITPPVSIRSSPVGSRTSLHKSTRNSSDSLTKKDEPDGYERINSTSDTPPSEDADKNDSKDHSYEDINKITSDNPGAPGVNDSQKSNSRTPSYEKIWEPENENSDNDKNAEDDSEKNDEKGSIEDGQENIKDQVDAEITESIPANVDENDNTDLLPSDSTNNSEKTLNYIDVEVEPRIKPEQETKTNYTEVSLKD